MAIASINERQDRGFTLIELLVIIAITGILASVVLASLNAARTRSRDASIKATMDQIRKQAEIYHAANGTYGVGYAQDSWNSCNGGGGSADTFFTSAPGGAGLMVNSLVEKISGAPSGTRVYCAVSATYNSGSWAFAAPLHQPAGTSTGWCVDSMGASKAVSFSFSTPGFPIGGYGTTFCP